jgi:hypothetical protein
MSLRLELDEHCLGGAHYVVKPAGGRATRRPRMLWHSSGEDRPKSGSCHHGLDHRGYVGGLHLREVL